MHTEMAPTSSGAQGKGEPNVAASAAKCVIGTGHPAIYRRYRGIADMNGRVASANSVEFDPQRHLARQFCCDAQRCPFGRLCPRNDLEAESPATLAKSVFALETVRHVQTRFA
jgi:hypothetical protein